MVDGEVSGVSEVGAAIGQLVRAMDAETLSGLGLEDLDGRMLGCQQVSSAVAAYQARVFTRHEAAMVEHPGVLEIVDQVLLPNYLLSSSLAIDVHPGETAQDFHFDDGGIRVQRPRPTYGVSTIWALDDFTEDNGATEVIPGSHLWGEERPEQMQVDPEKVIMPAGSVVVFSGLLWHRGGANQSDKPRLGITPQYCEPWARQLENMILATGPRAADYSERIQGMIGYSIHPPFMGYVDGMHPLRCLDEGYDPTSTGENEQSRRFWEDYGGRVGRVLEAET